MSINNVEIQDSVGNVYYPHTYASVVKYGDSDVGSALSELAHEKTSRTITVGTGKNFTTVQSAIDSIGKYLIYPVTIDIEIDAGIYNEDVLINGFYGGGSISINKNKITTDVSINSIEVNNCNCDISINRMKMTTLTKYGITLRNTMKTEIYYLEVTGTTTNNSSGAYAFDCPSVLIFNSTFSNRYGGIVASENSKIYSENNSGSNNQFGLLAYRNSAIGKNGTQPAGTGADTALYGGVIR